MRRELFLSKAILFFVLCWAGAESMLTNAGMTNLAGKYENIKGTTVDISQRSSFPAPENYNIRSPPTFTLTCLSKTSP